MSRAEADPELTDEAAGGESFTGRSLHRVEDRRILTGKAEYVHDRTPQNCAHMALLRSVHAHADFEVDASQIQDHPDCDLVMTAADLKTEFEPQPCGLKGFEEWSLADGRARFAGEPIAAVVAADRYIAEDLLDEISVSYEPLDPVVDPMEARKDQTLVHEDAETNVPDGECLTFGDIEEAFEDADRVVEGEYSWGRISGVPLETAGAVAEYDPETDTFDVHSNIQLHTLVDDTVYETLGYDPEDVNLTVPPDVGGSFGTKIAIHRYCNLVAMASYLLRGRPVKFVEDRVENLQGGDVHSSDREYRMRLAVDDDGSIRGLDTWFVDDFGAFPHYPVNQCLKPLAVVCNSYDVQNVRYEYELVLTNKTAQTAYRGFGVDPHLYALEAVIDEAARELRMDATELRRINLISSDQMPYRLPSHNVYDSGDYHAALDRIERIVDERERQNGGLLDPDVVERKREKGKYRGVQPSVLIEPGVSGADWTDRQRTDRETLDERPREAVEELPEYLRAEIRPDGTVLAHLHTDSSGQGHQTIVAQLLADELGVSPGEVQTDYLGSAESPTEYGSAASRMAVMLSGAAQGLGEHLRRNLRDLAAEEWGCKITETTFRDGGVDHIGGDERLELADIVAHEADLAPDDRRTSASFSYEHPATDIPEFDEAFRKKYPVYPTAAFAANAPIVEVDVRTGEVDILKFYSLRDCGTLLNPMIVDGQAHGGIAQGIGAALREEFTYDETGQPQAVTLFDYLLPSIENVPEMEIEHSETPSPFTVTGAKGTGEGGMIDAPASVASAINDALDPLGVTADVIPFTPHRARERLRRVDSELVRGPGGGEDA